MKTSELTGAALDWAVTQCELMREYSTERGMLIHKMAYGLKMPTYSANWAQGGPIIERERIRLDCPWNPGPYYATCKIDGKTAWVQGPTPLIAAMRCYVASKLGDTIELPEGLS